MAIRRRETFRLEWYDGAGTNELGKIDTTQLAIRNSSAATSIDLNGDGIVTNEDLIAQLSDKGLVFSDANLDDKFGSSDLVRVF